jgi:hypothetical protein
MAEGQSTTIAPAVEYRDVPGFPGYRVGSDGSVWVIARRRIDDTPRGAWHRLKAYTAANGYLGVNLWRGPKTKSQCRVHRLVLLAFVGPKPPGAWALHRDDNRLNKHRREPLLGHPAAERGRPGQEPPPDSGFRCCGGRAD